jgi:hypothetical protein
MEKANSDLSLSLLEVQDPFYSNVGRLSSICYLPHDEEKKTHQKHCHDASDSYWIPVFSVVMLTTRKLFFPSWGTEAPSLAPFQVLLRRHPCGFG